jgi:hypothetical protein
LVIVHRAVCGAPFFLRNNRSGRSRAVLSCEGLEDGPGGLSDQNGFQVGLSVNLR